MNNENADVKSKKSQKSIELKVKEDDHYDPQNKEQSQSLKQEEEPPQEEPQQQSLEEPKEEKIDEEVTENQSNTQNVTVENENPNIEKTLSPERKKLAHSTFSSPLKDEPIPQQQQQQQPQQIPGVSDF